MTMTRQRVMTVLGSVVLLAFGSAARADEDAAVTLYGVAEPGFVRIKWMADDWPVERVGFVVKRRRPLDTLDQKWSAVSSETISPNALPDHDLRLIESSDRDRQVLENRRASMLDAHVMLPQGAAGLCKRLAKEPEFRSYVRDQVKERMDFALSFGFGVVDRSIVATGHYEYGIFEVRPDGSTSIVAAARTEVDVVSLRPERVVLHGEASEGQARLLWIPLVWEQNWKGFQIWKRRASETSEPGAAWQPVSGLIEPGVWLNRKIETSGVDGDRLKRIEARERSVVGGMAEPLPPPDMRKRLSGSSIEDLRYLGSMFRRDYDFALLNGFGYIDRQFTGTSEYAAFPISGTGAVLTNQGARLLVEAFPPDDPALDVTPVVNEEAKQIRLTWTLPWSLLESKQIFGFDVYRRAKGAPLTKNRKVSDHVLSSSSSEAGLRTWIFVDNDVQVGQAYEYALVPVSVFQTPRRSFQWNVTRAVPAVVKPLDLAVAIDDVVESDRARRAISWHTSGADAGAASRFEIAITDMTRTNLDDATHVFVMPGNTRSATVDVSVVNGHVYRYEVAAIDAAGMRHPSESRTEMFVDTFVPGAPLGVTASCEVRDGVPLVRLRWSDVALTNPLVRGYAFWCDRNEPGVPRRMTSLPVSRTNQIELAMREATGRDLTLGVAAISVYGDQGEIGWTQCYVPSQDLPPPERLVGDLTGDGRAPRLTWQYPSLHELRGFRVFCNGQLAADEFQVPATVRQWVGNELPANRLQRFHVVAVDQDGHLSRESVQVELYRLQRSATTAALQRSDVGEP